MNISGNALVPVLQLICYASDALNIWPNLLLTALPMYITANSHCDCGIFILTLPYIYTIDPTSFHNGFS